jgi:GT2 family glycosyltransferase
MLDETIDFLESRLKEFPNYKYEIIVVSDGSKDKTVEVAETYGEKYGSDKVKCLKLIQNRGKGGAVQLVSGFTINTLLHLVYFFIGPFLPAYRGQKLL